MSRREATSHYPGYDVLAKRNTLSWNDATRQVIDHRLAMPRTPRFFSEAEWRTLSALCARILPQPTDRPPVPLPAFIDAKLHHDTRDGYRYATLPPQRDAWRIGLKALEAEAEATYQHAFDALQPEEQDALLRRMESGALHGPEWQGMCSDAFFKHRAVPDITSSYYAHPTAWSEIGFGGPAGPRGYVRLRLDRRDPWEAVEAESGDDEKTRRTNSHVR